MATEAQKKYYSKWRKENKGHVQAYENARRDKTNSRKAARRKVEKVLGKAAVAGKSVHHKDHNPKNNAKSNLAVRKNYHGFDGKGYKKKKK